MEDKFDNLMFLIDNLKSQNEILSENYNELLEKYLELLGEE